MKRPFIFLIIFLWFFSGCAWFKHKEEKTAVELASEGMLLYKGGKYGRAIDSFEKIRDWYPFSKYAILAELKIADANYHLKEYDQAIFAYEGFENLHPRNEAIPYVIYQMGMSNFEQIDTTDRDQTFSQKALNVFNRLIQQFPNDKYAKKAREKIKKCLGSLAGHEFYVGRFYLRGKHYQAALNRFKTVIQNYPDVGLHLEALRYITRVEGLMAEAEKQKKTTK
ncbi:MAG: outer membrane protein assembly factor BamD [Desulfobacterales bacterium]|nr:outer membrane protein assembly factor BamD [Desulfobacterales bacterium]